MTDTVLTALLYSLLSLLISYTISKKLSSPINRLITATKQLTKGNHHVTLLEKNSIFEIQELAAEFNQMAQTIHNHEKTLVNEINKATTDLSEKVAMLEVLASISNSVLEDEIQSFEVMKSTLIGIQKYIKKKQISLTFINQNKKFEVFELDQNGQISSFELQMADTSFESALNNKRMIVRNQLQSVTTSYYEQLLFNEGMRSLLVLPITAKNKAFGTLNIANQAPSYFSKDLIDKLTVFTKQIALALDRVSAYESFQKSSYHDYLTGLPNYRLLKICIQDALEKAKQNHSLVGILFLDLDRFKMVNDTFGHATGDLLLKYIAKIIVTCLSDKETVCRIGGDEFSILLSTISEREEAVLIAKKIMKALENPVIIKGYKIPISASIGISFFSEDGADADSLIKHADRAMYRVKQQGKNNYAIYAKNEDDQLANQIVFENEIQKALTREEFVVYYQPKINIQFGTISGVEALVRWNHPDKGLIAPGSFIPQAEETGLIIQIGEFVLRQACKQCVTWQSIGFPPIPISVNLSLNNFYSLHLLALLKKS